MRWFGVARWTYNQCVIKYQQDKEEAKRQGIKHEKPTEFQYRDYCVNSNAPLLQDPTVSEWVEKVPWDVRDEARRDFIKAVESNEAKRYKNWRHHFDFKLRTRKDRQQSIVIEEKHWGVTKTGKERHGMYGFLNHIRISGHQALPDTINHDLRIIRTRLGHYYLVVPYMQPQLSVSDHLLLKHRKPSAKQGENQALSNTSNCGCKRVVSMDPGVRIFQTCYDHRGAVYNWAQGDYQRINRLCYHYDQLQSRWSQKDVKHKQRYAMKKAGMRLQFKIRNLVDELHKKLCLWLCENYQVILLPEFRTSDMVNRSKRTINGRTARAMATLAHYRFRQRLLHKSREYTDCKVIIVDEPYTSKTCGRCGTINWNLGGKEIFVCPRCNHSACRDGNAARNILLRYLTITNMSRASL